ncbi:MAG: M24 family metallopeptidase [Candidatus Saccharicenans sp.]
MISRRKFLEVSGLTALTLSGAAKLFSSTLDLQANQDKKLEQLLKNIKPLDNEDYANRLEKAARLISEQKVGAFFVEPGPSLQYFTGVNWWRSERTFGAVLIPGRLPVWVCSKFEEERAREMIPVEQEIRTWEENESPFQLIKTILSDYGQNKILAIEPSTRAFIIYGIKKEAPEIEIVDGSYVSNNCRGIKTEKEILYLEAANRITKLAYRQAFQKLKEGLWPEELADLIRQEHRKFGISGSGGPSFGQNSAFPHGSRKVRPLHYGDVVLVDGGGQVQGYNSDVTRSLVFGQPTDQMRKVWEIVKKAQSAALKACRPGVACEEVDRAARRVIEEAGYGPGYKYFLHRLGHGIGLEGHEYPYLVQGNKLKIQPGMTFSNEPGIYIYGQFGIRIEDCMVVTEDGARILGGLEAVSIDQPFADN